MQEVSLKRGRESGFLDPSTLLFQEGGVMYNENI